MLPELEAIKRMLQYSHHHINAALEELDEEGLNWVPTGVEATNSVYALALHIAWTQVAFAGAMLGERLRLEIPELEKGSTGLNLRGTSAERAKELLRKAAEVSNEAFEKATPEHLVAEATLPGGGKGTGRSYAVLMVSHTAEHVGHMELTRQLYLAQHKE